MQSVEKKTYTCIIVDDLPLDRLALQTLLRDYPYMELRGSFGSAEQALEHIGQNRLPDALFLDIDMPGQNGLGLRKELIAIPACIFITAHPEFALDGFELAALDYIVKPLTEERLEKAMRRLKDYLDAYFKAELFDFSMGPATVVIKEGYNQVKLPMQEIIYLEALRNYTAIVTRKKKYCVLSPLGTLLQEKNFNQFVRIHRSYAVNGNTISGISASEVRVNDILLPLGKSYRESVGKYFNA